MGGRRIYSCFWILYCILYENSVHTRFCPPTPTPPTRLFSHAFGLDACFRRLSVDWCGLLGSFVRMPLFYPAFTQSFDSFCPLRTCLCNLVKMTANHGIFFTPSRAREFPRNSYAMWPRGWQVYVPVVAYLAMICTLYKSLRPRCPCTEKQTPRTVARTALKISNVGISVWGGGGRGVLSFVTLRPEVLRARAPKRRSCAAMRLSKTRAIRTACDALCAPAVDRCSPSFRLPLDRVEPVSDEPGMLLRRAAPHHCTGGRAHHCHPDGIHGV